MMNDDFDLDAATGQALGAGIRDEREKIKLDDLIAKYPDGVHICGYESCQGKTGGYAVFAMAEGNYYFSGGGDLAKLAERWEAYAEGDISAINEALEAKPLKFKIWKARTQTGKTYTKVKRIKEPVRDENRQSIRSGGGSDSDS